LVIGGASGGGVYKRDVWKSNDGGSSWILVTANAAWSGECAVTEYEIPLSIILYVDVFLVPLICTARCGHTTVILSDGSVLLVGGKSDAYNNDVWKSLDGGSTWLIVTANAAWKGKVRYLEWHALSL